MPVKYSPLLKLQLRHDYFPQAACPVVNIVATGATQRVMAALNLRQVQRDSGMEIFYGESAGNSTPLSEVDGAVRLSFWLQSSDPRFRVYTDVPIQGSLTAVYHGSNLVQTDNNTQLFSAGGAEQLLLREPMIRIGNVVTLDDIVLTDETGNVLQAGENTILEGPDFRLTDKTLTADLSALPAGRYRLTGAGTPEYFVLTGPDFRDGDLGLLTIYVGDLAADGTQLLTDGMITPATFTVAFHSRATRWRYHLIGEGYHNFRISGADFPVTDPPQTRALPDGTVATVLVSQHPLHLRQRPELHLQLTADRRDDQSVIAIRLPIATADGTQLLPDPSATAGEAFFSDIYVYI